MAKGYWIAHVDVSDAEQYENYRNYNSLAFETYGGRFLVRGGASQQREGTGRARSVVIEFPSYTAAVECYESEEYQTARAFRLAASQGDIVIVEGYDG